MDNDLFENRSGDGMAPAAHVEEPPTPSKLLLIRRFLQLNGTQAELDSGGFLDRYGLPGGPLEQSLLASGKEVTLRDTFIAPIDALRRAYLPRKAEFQEAYEAHVNWEFTEDELVQLVAFLGSPTGKHFLDGRWRMTAYVGTNMEEVVEVIISEAKSILENR